jgi:hypothetical protein
VARHATIATGSDSPARRARETPPHPNSPLRLNPSRTHYFLTWRPPPLIRPPAAHPLAPAFPHPPHPPSFACSPRLLLGLAPSFLQRQPPCSSTPSPPSLGALALRCHGRRTLVRAATHTRAKQCSEREQRERLFSRVERDVREHRRFDTAPFRHRAVSTPRRFDAAPFHMRCP